MDFSDAKENINVDLKFALPGKERQDSVYSGLQVDDHDIICMLLCNIHPLMCTCLLFCSEYIVFHLVNYFYSKLVVPLLIPYNCLAVTFARD